MEKLERIYTVPLGDAYKVPRNKRAPRAVKLLRAFVKRHMKAEADDVVISEALNSHIWIHSIQKPPRRVKIRAIRQDGAVRAYLADEKIEEEKPAEKKEEKPPEKKEETPPKEEKPAEKKQEKTPPKEETPEKKVEKPAEKKEEKT